MVTRGFTGRQRSPDIAKRLPPGQSLTDDFPVLSAGPTPHIRTEDWSFTLKVGPKPLARWDWAQFNALPQTKQTRDIHCVTKWSKLDTPWEGVLIDDILAAAGLDAPPTPFTLAHSFDGYSTNVPTADLVGGKAMIALRYEGKSLPPDHGGPARLLGAASLFLEVGEMGERAPVHRARRSRLLGAARLSHLWRPLARAAFHR